MVYDSIHQSHTRHVKQSLTHSRHPINAVKYLILSQILFVMTTLLSEKALWYFSFFWSLRMLVPFISMLEVLGRYWLI